MNIEEFIHPIIIDLPYIEPDGAVRALRESGPLIFLGGNDDFQMAALAFAELSSRWMDQFRFRDHVQNTSNSFFQSGVVGLLPYKDEDQDFVPSYFGVQAALLWNKKAKKLQLSYLRSLDQGTWQDVMRRVDGFRTSRHTERTYKCEGIPQFELTADCSPQNYLENAQKCIDDIRNGRFYQINILKYFSLSSDLSMGELAKRFQDHSGPYGSWIETENLRLASFSPEQFVSISDGGDFATIDTYPIKGTIERDSDLTVDSTKKALLRDSEKDRAELNMIIDLMRNDLYRICYPGSVSVQSRGDIHSFRHVHHRMGHVSGKLLPSLSFDELWKCLLPSGSITGAPKKEVQKAIRQIEGRSRNYFMGNVFYWDPGNGLFDSSVLIRTLVGQKAAKTWNYEYAAGSGIVARSQPELELREIYSKTQVLQAHEMQCQ